MKKEFDRLVIEYKRLEYLKDLSEQDIFDHYYPVIQQESFCSF